MQQPSDFGIDTPGNMFVFEHLACSGQPEYRIKDWRPLSDVGATGSWKATSDGQLAFVTVDCAGHSAPGDVREGGIIPHFAEMAAR